METFWGVGCVCFLVFPDVLCLCANCILDFPFSLYCSGEIKSLLMNKGLLHQGQRIFTSPPIFPILYNSMQGLFLETASFLLEELTI